MDVISSLFDLLLELASKEEISIDAPSSSTGSNNLLSQLKSLACAALLSLVVARGDTGKILAAIAALLTSPELINNCDEIETPNILISLQRSVHAVLLGKINRPDWLSYGFPNNSLCDCFHVQIPTDTCTHVKQSSLAFDGKYLFIYCGNVLHKIGSGYCGTVKGQVIASRSIGTHKLDSGMMGWIGYINDYLYVQTNNWTKNEMIKLDRNHLNEIGKVTLGISQIGPSACTSDGENLILITSTKDDCFVIRTLKPSNQQFNAPYLMPVVHELTVKLSHKCLNVCGYSAANIFDFPQNAIEQGKNYYLRPIVLNEVTDEVLQISTGKDFAVIRLQSGKLIFNGKSQSLGIKQNSGGKWCELPITKSPKITFISIGHEGSHALLVSEEGSVYFVGISKRGEDGEPTKAKRQPKATKPKKMLKMEGKYVESAACNHGTSALVTKNGELYIFGKDSQFADKSTNLVTALKGVFVTQVALGKAHALVLGNKGNVYSFGISNKGQCGHDSMQPLTKEIPHDESEQVEQQIDMTEDVSESQCSIGQHRWNHDQCMICTVCGECTGYGLSCIASGKSERNPGMRCGCGTGDAGCIDCGCCRACESVSKEMYSKEMYSKEENSEYLLAQYKPVDFGEEYQNAIGNAIGSLSRLRKLASSMRDENAGKDNVEAEFVGANGVMNNHDYEEVQGAVRGRGGLFLRDRLVNYRSRRIRHPGRMLRNYMENIVPGKINDDDNVEGMDNPHEIIDRAVCNVINFDHDQGSDGETTKLTPIPPTKLNIPHRITQIACGLHHSVLLSSTGEVYTFGSNQHGQLGLGDFVIRETPCLVNVNSTIVQISAGSNHTVLLNSQGQIYSFGSNNKGQLGRAPPAIDYAWNATPGLIPYIGPQFGRKATWISCSGDHTFVKFDESLINPMSLSSARIMANRKCIVIVPPNYSTNFSDYKYESNERVFRSLVINRSDGSCKTFNDQDQLELSNFSAVCLDNLYDVLWTYNCETQTISRHNIIAVEAKLPQESMMLPSILLPELSLPQKSSALVNRTTAALNLLCTLDTLTATNQLGWSVQDDEQTKNQIAKIYSKEDFSSVCRFESHGGGWGFSSHSIEAIRFMADTDILLGGYGLFGGRGEYTAKLRLYDIGTDGGEQEGDGEILAETDEIPYDCAAKQKYPILFDEPIPLQANRWYVAWARITGPSSDCGSSGQSVVNTEDQVVFYFKSSKKSNNGTDVNAGQIPQLLYKVNYLGNDALTFQNASRNNYDGIDEPICMIGRDFYLSVTSDCFYSLLTLLRWSWDLFKANLCDINSGSAKSTNVINSIVIDLKHLSFTCCACLHLIKIYVNEVFPNGSKQKSLSNNSEAVKLSECVYDVRILLKCILSDPPTLPLRNQTHSAEMTIYINQIMEETHETFLCCYHAFYPTNSLRWKGLCDLLYSKEYYVDSKSDYLLSSMLAALCRPWIRLTHTFPMIYGLDVVNIQSPSDLLSPTGKNYFFKYILN